MEENTASLIKVIVREKTQDLSTITVYSTADKNIAWKKFFERRFSKSYGGFVFDLGCEFNYTEYDNDGELSVTMEKYEGAGDDISFRYFDRIYGDWTDKHFKDYYKGKGELADYRQTTKYEHAPALDITIGEDTYEAACIQFIKLRGVTIP